MPAQDLGCRHFHPARAVFALSLFFRQIENYPTAIAEKSGEYTMMERQSISYPAFDPVDQTCLTHCLLLSLSRRRLNFQPPDDTLQIFVDPPDIYRLGAQEVCMTTQLSFVLLQALALLLGTNN